MRTIIIIIVSKEKKICEEVSTRIVEDPGLHTLSFKVELDVAADGSEAAVKGMLEEHVARARPSRYTKRRCMKEPNSLRLSLSAARNQLPTVR